MPKKKAKSLKPNRLPSIPELDRDLEELAHLVKRAGNADETVVREISAWFQNHPGIWRWLQMLKAAALAELNSVSPSTLLATEQHGTSNRSVRQPSACLRAALELIRVEKARYRVLQSVYLHLTRGDSKGFPKVSRIRVRSAQRLVDFIEKQAAR